MSDRVVRLVLSGSSAGAIAALEAVGIKAEEVGTKTGAAFGDKVAGKVTGAGGVFQKLGNTVTALGLPFGEVFTRMGDKVSDADTKGQKLGQTLASVGKVALIAGAAGFAVVAGESLKLGVNFQQSTAALAATAGIPVAVATKIGDAFLATAGKSTFSGQQMLAAYGPVAAQLASVNGKVLSVAQSTQFMKSATDLAEASGGDLTSTTASLAAVMQAYHLNTTQAAGATDVLYNVSRLTNQPLSSLTPILDRLKARLGDLAPSLKDVGTLMAFPTVASLGSRGAMIVSTALQTLLGTTEKLSAAQAKAANAEATKVSVAKNAVAKAALGVQTAEDGLAASAGKSAAAQQSAADGVTKAKLVLAQAQSQLTAAQKDGAPIANANVEAFAKLGVRVFDASGKFVGMRDLIAQLQPKLAGMTEAQRQMALTSLFGASAAQVMGQVVAGGVSAYDKAASAVTKAGAAHAAAEKQSSTFKGTMEKLKATGEDLGTKFGLLLIPVVTRLGQIVAKVTDFFMAHKTAAEAIGIVIALLVAGPIAMYIVSMVTAAAATIAAAAPILAIIAVLALVGVAIYELVSNWSTVWGAIKAVVEDAWKFIDGTFVHPIEDFFSSIVGFIKDHWQLILAIITGPIGLATYFITSHFQGIVDFFSGLVGTIGGFFSSIGSGIKDAFKDAFDFVAGIWNNSVGSLSFHIPSWVPVIGGDGFSMPKIPVLDTGGVVSSPTIAALAQNSVPEIVSPVPQLRKVVAEAIGGGGGSGQPVQLVLDGRVVGQLLWPHVRRAGLAGSARNAVKVGLA